MSDITFPTACDPLQVAVDLGLVDETVYDVPANIKAAFRQKFAEKTQNIQEWTPEDREFAAAVSERYLEAFYLRDKAKKRLEDADTRQGTALMATEQVGPFLQRIGVERSIVNYVNTVLTASISRQAFEQMVTEGIGDKSYDTVLGHKFLGTIVRYSMEAYNTVAPHSELPEVHPQPVGGDDRCPSSIRAYAESRGGILATLAYHDSASTRQR